MAGCLVHLGFGLDKSSCTSEQSVLFFKKTKFPNGFLRYEDVKKGNTMIFLMFQVCF